LLEADRTSPGGCRYSVADVDPHGLPVQQHQTHAVWHDRLKDCVGSALGEDPDVAKLLMALTESRHSSDGLAWDDAARRQMGVEELQRQTTEPSHS